MNYVNQSSGSKYFYCYSLKLTRFCQAFGLRYISVGINHNSNTRYYTFEKSARLDEIIALWNDVKTSIPEEEGDDDGY